MASFGSEPASGDFGSPVSGMAQQAPTPSSSPAAVRSSSVFKRRRGVRSERVVGDIVATTDFLLIAGAAVIAKWVYIGAYLGSSQDVGLYLTLGAIAAFIAVLVFRNQRLYTIELLSGFRGTTRRVAFGMAVAAVVILSVCYLLKVSEDLSRGWMISWIAAASALIIFNHYLVARAMRSWVASGLFTRNIAIYGSGEIALRMIEHLDLAGANLRVLGVFDDLPRGVAPRMELTGGLSNLIQLGQTADIDEVLLALPLSDERRISGLVTQLSVLPIDIRLCPDMAAFQMRPLGIVNYNHVGVLELVRRPLNGWGPIVKNLEDRILASLALLAVLPALALIAVAIKLDSRGPIFFRQRRHGFNHQVITVLKFRTMHVTQDGLVVPQALRDDPRVTRVGKWLRRTSLDELPQLLNVIDGEMSLVGPRPHALAHNEYYSALLETYANRHRMKPGITGWAQIHGFRGETDTPEKMRKRVEFDLYYIENWSLWLDFKIIALTPFLGLVGKNAF